MTCKRYFNLVLILSFLLLSAVALTNYYIDPANIYYAPSAVKTNTASEYVKRLVKTKNGLLWPNDSWNGRDIKSSLARANIDVDCAVIGSSHVMQVSSISTRASLTNICQSIINLGVSGGTFEDFLALSYILLERKKSPKKMIFGIDPWTIDFNRDPQWVRYKDEYYSMEKRLSSKDVAGENNESFRVKYLINLINPQYFSRSTMQMTSRKLKIIYAPVFDFSEGIKDPVLLPDGSLVYSRERIQEDKARTIPLGGSIYKIKSSGPQMSRQAIPMFKHLVKMLNDQGIQTFFLLTPYHHNVWADRLSVTTKALLEVEPQVREIANELDTKVLGSYNPDKIGCTADEFLDFMHAKVSCLSKISN